MPAAPPVSRVSPVPSRLIGVLALLVAASGCSLLGGDDEPGPETVAEQLATSAQGLSLEGVPLTGQAVDPDPLEQATTAVTDVPVSVELLEVEELEGDEEPAQALARLGWSWELAGDFWDYESSAVLVRGEEGWQVDWSPTVLHPELAEGQSLAVTTLSPPRGRVLGAGGEPLVVERKVLRYGVDKARVPQGQARRSARRVADVFDLDRAAYVKKVEAYGPEAFVEAIVLRADDAVDQVPPSYADIPGAAVIEDAMPLAPTRDFAAELLGRVGPATAEVVEASEGRIRPGDDVGLSGLQARYDEQLFGTRGVLVRALPADGTEGEATVLHERAAQAGQDLALTLDRRLQERAEELLERFGGTASALVAVRPSDGHLLAAASGPGAELNAATFGQYAPGSTFKVATALALLRAGLEPQDPLPCPATTVVDGRTFGNYDDYPATRLGRIPMRTAFAHSCNTAMIGARDQLGEGDLAAAAASLGLGVDHDLGFPAYFGQVPEPETETERAASTIGQGRVLASPMAMAAVAASVAGGRTVLPVLLPDQPAPTPSGPELTAQEAEQLRGLMRAVVVEGSGRLLADVPGAVGAKTGTAEFGEPGPDGSLPTHAWMIGYRDDLAVAVFVERGDSGSGTAGPVLETFLRQ
ncbi:penicillin-binding transpeptidase domain-containing protein [Nocardioides campestrisoli]|uniref:penicillin-binding transpeptidase domain-containing protein n=1 Tax=Nocardioides campestrisoli TaxID=2736757 RepID=UPI00163D45B9|nr:penicillin-binding transpeptidase domain-containing protein [Nocardioides campestrisoli]